jgi:hypothetical protein
MDKDLNLGIAEYFDSVHFNIAQSFLHKKYYFNSTAICMRDGYMLDK